ncbi:GNAT family N-acetyltransferase [Streptomyces sp. DSM 44917]|uniref:GNAT family N-acetyltransferase n=1 Tax=Streptomyces boetiae TaxID=3075541 RepID=A0ABU2L2R7_9ACTN|nr:GNAT family N-acetyltransferase [Streptomyces sp. DSM 44917]MDT0305853.1 GNAT family N-acetyltransferase [Streptomyces sp. DSM 44917]
MSDTEQVTVRDNPEGRRFEARLDPAAAEPAGFTEYRRREGGVVEYFHTEVDPAFEGRGVGGALARAALDDARARGLRVRATCPFVSGWLDRHPDYHDLRERPSL